MPLQELRGNTTWIGGGYGGRETAMLIPSGASPEAHVERGKVWAGLSQGVLLKGRAKPPGNRA